MYASNNKLLKVRFTLKLCIIEQLVFGATRCATLCDIVRHCATLCDIVRHCATLCDIVRHRATLCTTFVDKNHFYRALNEPIHSIFIRCDEKVSLKVMKIELLNRD
jgi:hypothetical protein